MTRRVIILGILLVIVILLIDGRVPKKFCDRYLAHEWGLASAVRQSDDQGPRRPTRKEAGRLRTAIRVCKPFTARFDLVANLLDDEVYGSIPLIMLAVELDDPELLAGLVADGHPIDGLPSWGNLTTLHFATYRQADRAFNWLLENGVDPDAMDDDGYTAIMYAASQPRTRFNGLKALIDRGVDVNAMGADGWTPLARAVRSGRLDNAALLVDAGADIGMARQFLLELADNSLNDGAAAGIRDRVYSFDKRLGNRVVR